MLFLFFVLCLPLNFRCLFCQMFLLVSFMSKLCYLCSFEFNVCYLCHFCLQRFFCHLCVLFPLSFCVYSLLLHSFLSTFSFFCHMSLASLVPTLCLLTFAAILFLVICIEFVPSIISLLLFLLQNRVY